MNGFQIFNSTIEQTETMPPQQPQTMSLRARAATLPWNLREQTVSEIPTMILRYNLAAPSNELTTNLLMVTAWVFNKRKLARLPGKADYTV